MLKIKFYCNNHANIHSKVCETFTPEQLGHTEEEWRKLSKEKKQAILRDWALERYDYWMGEEDEIDGVAEGE